MQLSAAEARGAGGGAPLTALEAARAVWRKGGVLGFYRGMGAAVLKSTPAGCITFVVYENAKAALGAREAGAAAASKG